MTPSLSIEESRPLAAEFFNPDAENNRRNRPVLAAVLSLGFSSLVTQILILREFLTVFSGNELTIGLVLGNWLWLTGAGSWLGRRADSLRRPGRWLVLALLVIAVAPPLQIASLRLFRGLVLPGLVMGIDEAFLASLFLLLPYCLASGFLLPLLSKEVSKQSDPSQTGLVYIGDTAGGIVGGLLFSSLFVFFLLPLQTAFLLTLLNLAAVFFLLFQSRGRAILVASVLFLSIGLIVPPWERAEQTTLRFLFPGEGIVSFGTTPYGQLVLAEREGQTTVFQNGVPMASSENPAVAEETIHYALAHHPRPDRVLLISGSLSGAIGEVLKYPVRQVDCVESDPAVLMLAERLIPKANDPRLRLIAQDARRFLRASNDFYDAILMDLPDPATVQGNRFFTREFFELVRQRLRPDGVFSFGLTGAENYATPEQRLLNSSVYQALKPVFPHIRLIPGARQFFIASDRPLAGDIATFLRERGIATLYVNDDYLRAKLTPDRLDMAQKMVSLPVPANRDFLPVSASVYLSYWLRQFEGSGLFLPTLLMIGIASFLFVLLFGSKSRAVPAVLCATGFAGMALEVILLVAFQIRFGFVYRQMGLLITAFLIGTVLGAAWASRSEKSIPVFFRLDALIALTAFLLVPVLHLLHDAKGALASDIVSLIAYPLLTALAGFLTGAEFPLAARIGFQGTAKTAGTLYTVDLLGASLGALVTGIFLVPQIGIVPTLYVIGAMKLATAVSLKIGQVPSAEVELAPAPNLSFRAAGFLLFLFAAIGVLFVSQQTGTVLYAFSFLPPYHWALLVLLGVGIVLAIRGWKKSSLNRWVHYILFAPLAFFPLFRCYFKVPFLFCHVCPRLCVFGFLRPYLVPFILTMNLERKQWCSHLCPIGTLQDGVAKMEGKRWPLPSWLKWFPHAVLIFTAVSYFTLKADHEGLTRPGGPPPESWDTYTFFFRNAYTATVIVILVSVALLVVSSRLKRSFCRLLCPIGTCSDILLRLERKGLETHGVEKKEMKEESHGSE